MIAFFSRHQEKNKKLFLTTLLKPQILIIEALLLKAVNNDLDCYQIGLCHMNAKSKSKWRVQYQIIAEVTSFVPSEGKYVNGNTEATSQTGPKMRFLSPFFWYFTSKLVILDQWGVICFFTTFSFSVHIHDAIYSFELAVERLFRPSPYFRGIPPDVYKKNCINIKII